MPNYFFSRFRLVLDLEFLPKIEFLYKGLSSAAEVEFRKDFYKFMGAEIVKDGSENYIIGYIIKYKPNDKEPSFDDKYVKIEIDIKNRILAEVGFIIDAKTGILIFEEDRQHILKTSFPVRFKSLFEKNINENSDQINISAITKAYKFVDRLVEVKTIKKVVINLVPSNPSTRDLWKSVQDDLKTKNISNYKEVQESRAKGKGIIIDDETKSKFLMSEDGYGDSLVSGKDSLDKPITISTEDKNHQECETHHKPKSIKDLIETFKARIGEIAKRKDENKAPST